jgi:xanthine/uracil/vitamin C permease (AzgA family)
VIDDYNIVKILKGFDMPIGCFKLKDNNSNLKTEFFAGLTFGFIAYTVIKIVTGNITQVKPAMWIITVLSIIHFIV